MYKTNFTNSFYQNRVSLFTYHLLTLHLKNQENFNLNLIPFNRLVVLIGFIQY